MKELMKRLQDYCKFTVAFNCDTKYATFTSTVDETDGHYFSFAINKEQTSPLWLRLSVYKITKDAGPNHCVYGETFVTEKDCFEGVIRQVADVYETGLVLKK